METNRVDTDEWSARARALAGDGWWLADLCAVDRLGGGSGGVARLGERPPGRLESEDSGESGELDRRPQGDKGRFEVVVQLLHHEQKQRMSVHVEAAGDPPTVPSVADVWRGADFMEREAYDLFGIHFEGHPNLTRILMPDEWEGHPLRKDYGVGKVPVEFVPQPFLQIEGPGQAPSPVGSGYTVDRLGQPVAKPRPES